MIVSQNLGRIQSRNQHFQKVHSIFFKTVVFLHALPTWDHGRGHRPLKPPLLLLAARRAQRVNDELVKVLDLLFLSISFGNEDKLSKNRIFSFLDQSTAFT